MKTKAFVLLFMLLVSFFLKAEESFVHDHDICRFNNTTIDLEIRGWEKYTTVTESDYGEFIHVRYPSGSTRISTGESFGRYRMLKSTNDICNKVLALPVRQGELAFFILKDNRPFTDELMVLYFHPKTHKSELVKARIFVKEGKVIDKKVFFRLGKDEETKVGTLTMGNKKFNTMEKPFEPWVSFDGTRFKLDREMSYEQFEYKSLLNKNDFDKIHDLSEATFKIASNGREKFILIYIDALSIIPHRLAADE